MNEQRNGSNELAGGGWVWLMIIRRGRRMKRRDEVVPTYIYPRVEPSLILRVA